MRSRSLLFRGAVCLVVAGLIGSGLQRTAVAQDRTGADTLAAGDASEAVPLEPYREEIPGSIVGFDMVPVPGGTVTVVTEDGEQTVDVAPFWIARTELPWDVYDIYAFQLDRSQEDQATGADAVSRPSKPYGAPDHGFGHQGYAAISMTYHAAQQFCEWLSARTGHTYRLPTDAEWTWAAQSADPSTSYGEALDEAAWYWDNAFDKTHPIAEKAPNALSLHDMLGNAAEWVTGYNDEPVVRGGSYRDKADRVGIHARAYQTPEWNMTDPQIPKSRWWLSDGSFVGFRVVRVP